MRELRSQLGRHPPTPLDVEVEKRAGWQKHGVLVVAEQDPRLTRSERQIVRRVGEKLYGKQRSALDGYEQKWTATLVADRVAEAADTLARLPDQRVRGHYDLWPKLIGAAGRQAGPAAASPEAIDRMDEALGWLMWLEPEERQLVWLRAEGLPWKWITRRMGIGRTTAWQRWTTALLKIVVRLDTVEQIRPDIKPLNKLADSVLQRG